VPISLWFRGEARSFLRDYLSPSAIRRRGLFSLNYVERLLNEHEAGTADHGARLWALLNVELWYSLFIDAQPGSVSAGNRGSMLRSAQAGRRGASE